ncbi:hybrid sensor histidine kinase/response regulator [Halococcus saccharolyticus]|uniref:histidine kinase n=1 Tax=Halococcus saccharolyticus DSM 5350 TaxID=1227455 RepID=M0ML44_9EURY|nr:PAS domain S-box protein [Halococcus saccharolyticus]EMA46083.1 pas domain s-box [Halococcus saccharolyticus DSM 5350]
MNGVETDSILILHVDDDSEVLDLTRSFLERKRERFEVKTATTAREGLSRLAESDSGIDSEVAIDCIVSDYDMPDMDGLEFLDAVRENYPKLPFLLFTGEGSEAVASEAISAGVTDYLQKGGTEQFDLLANRIENYTQNRVTERDLERAEKRRQLAIEATSDIVWERTVGEGTVTLFGGSDGAFGYDAGSTEIGFDEWISRIHPEDRQRINEDLENTLENNRDRFSAEYPLQANDGSYMIVSDRGRIEYNDAGDPVLLVGAIRDITEQKEREHDLKATQARFRALAQNTTLGVVTIDSDSTVEYANNAVSDIFGYRPEELIGESLAKVIPERLETAHFEALNRYLETGEQRLDWDWTELPACHRDGHEIQVGIAFGEYTTDGEQHFTGIIRDVTDRREREEYRRRLYEISADAELTTDETIDRVLELGCEYFDMESGFLTHIDDDTQRIVRSNSPHEAIQPGSECPLSEAYCQKTIAMDEPLTVAHAMTEGWEDDPAYGRFGLEAYIGAKLVVDGESYGTVCFADRSPRETEFSELDRSFIDLVVRGIKSTLERHKYESELERQNEQLGEFASVISHDLRNPLTVADGYLELACETGDDEYFMKIGNAHDRMDAIIDDVLTLTRQGERIAETSRVGLAAVAEDAWENVATADAELAMADELGDVDADVGRLKQLFENLYRNAVEHGTTSPPSRSQEDTVEHAGETITVRVGRYPAGFYVEDDGPGIPESEHDDVFDSGYTTSEEGTGMGLSIVETIATAHGWGIGVDEGTEGGARFKIQLGMTRGGSDDLLFSD